MTNKPCSCGEEGFHHPDILNCICGEPLAHTPASIHFDDQAVDRFAAAMKEKLAKARDKGQSGWDNPDECSKAYLANLLVEHLSKGNDGTFEDVANFSMMLHQRCADPRELAKAFTQGARRSDAYVQLYAKNTQLVKTYHQLVEELETLRNHADSARKVLEGLRKEVGAVGQFAIDTLLGSLPRSS